MHGNSSLNFANRTKKVEVKEVENEVIFKGTSRSTSLQQSLCGGPIQRQPLRPLPNAENVLVLVPPSTIKTSTTKPPKRPTKAFSVYSDTSITTLKTTSTVDPPSATSKKRKGDSSSSSFPTSNSSSFRPAKLPRHQQQHNTERASTSVSQEALEQMVERKVEEILAARAMQVDTGKEASVPAISEQVQRRLDALEQRMYVSCCSGF